MSEKPDVAERLAALIARARLNPGLARRLAAFIARVRLDPELARRLAAFIAGARLLRRCRRDAAPLGVQVQHYELVKRDAATGRIFEIVEGGDGRPDRVTFREAGAPAKSYADLPYQPNEGTG